MLRSWRLVGIAITRAIVCGVLGMFERSEAVERVDRPEPGVAGPGAVAAFLFEMRQGTRRSAARRDRRCPAGMAACRSARCAKRQQQPERVAVGGDRLRAGVALGDQPLGEERLQRWREQRS